MLREHECYSFVLTRELARWVLLYGSTLVARRCVAKHHCPTEPGSPRSHHHRNYACWTDAQLDGSSHRTEVRKATEPVYLHLGGCPPATSLLRGNAAMAHVSNAANVRRPLKLTPPEDNDVNKLH